MTAGTGGAASPDHGLERLARWCAYPTVFRDVRGFPRRSVFYLSVWAASRTPGGFTRQPKQVSPEELVSRGSFKDHIY